MLSMFAEFHLIVIFQNNLYVCIRLKLEFFIHCVVCMYFVKKSQVSAIFRNICFFIYFYKNAHFSTFPQKRSSKMRLWKSINMTADFGQINQKTKRPKCVMNRTIELHWNINSIKGCSIRVGNIARPHLVWPKI